jgi:hypothetical protein
VAPQSLRIPVLGAHVIGEKGVDLGYQFALCRRCTIEQRIHNPDPCCHDEDERAFTGDFFSRSQNDVLLQGHGLILNFLRLLPQVIDCLTFLSVGTSMSGNALIRQFLDPVSSRI